MDQPTNNQFRETSNYTLPVNGKKLLLTRGNNLVKDMVRFARDSKNSPVITTGLTKLDDLITGIELGRIYTIAAPSGVGKTIFGVHLFDTILKQKDHPDSSCLYISTEMSKEVLTARLICRESGIPESAILRDNVYEDKQAKYTTALQTITKRLKERNPIIVDKVNQKDEVIAIIENAAFMGTKIIILDHFHNIRSKGDIYKDMVDAAHDIQETVIKHNVTCIIFAQMSKQDVRGDDPEVKMARGASDLLDISDVFMVLERAKLEGKLKDPTKLKIHVSKNRWGSTGTVDARVKFPEKTIHLEDTLYSNSF